MDRLSGKIALITGSSSGIGRGVALGFAREGADGVGNYPSSHERAAADAVVAEIESVGRRAISVEADVAVADDVERLVTTAEQTFGRIDILVNNAGIAHTAPLEAIPIDTWDRLIAVHLRSCFLTTRLVIRGMYARDYGRIINTASQLAYKGAPGLTHYTAAKGAIISFTRSLALEIGARNVNVNSVAPGATFTPILADVPPDLLQAVRQAIPKGRIAEVADIVPSYIFLASEDARHIQGQCLSPNGGDVFL